MHEAGAVGAAIEKVIQDWPATGTGGQLELEIRDATRAEAGSVAFFAAAILADHGFETTTFTVQTRDVHCALCGTLAAAASPGDPQCDACGAPLPQVPGPAVVCREVSPCA
jgi:cysteine sulfinate desulfinase/cysteine desulfurase-like protein